MKNLNEVLKAGGSSLEHVVKVNVFITTMKDFEAMNKGYSQVMPKPLPVSSIPNPIADGQIRDGGNLCGA